MIKPPKCLKVAVCVEEKLRPVSVTEQVPKGEHSLETCGAAEGRRQPLVSSQDLPLEIARVVIIDNPLTLDSE